MKAIAQHTQTCSWSQTPTPDIADDEVLVRVHYGLVGCLFAHSCRFARRGTNGFYSRCGNKHAYPQNRAVAVHEAIKPLLDGLIAACHRHVGTETDVVAQRGADSLGQDFRDVAERLMTDAGAVLGPRRFLWPWRNSVQWNPADDRCVATAVHVVPDPDAAEPLVDAGVFPVSPRAD